MTSCRERGSASVYMIGVAVCSFLMVALVLVGARMLQARSDAFGLAAAAARAGAQELDDDAAVEGRAVLDPAGAEQAALEYLAARGAVGVVSVEGDTVTVTVIARVASSLDGSAADTAEFRATASARALKVPGS